MKAAASLNPPGSTTSHSCTSFVIRVLTAPSLILSLLMNSTNRNVRKLHNDKFDSKKAAKVGLDASLKTSIVPDDPNPTQD